MKEKNKSLLINSLISISMCVMPFSVMAADHDVKLSDTVKTLNSEQNQPHPETDNTKALYPDVKSDNENYRTGLNGEDFNFSLTKGGPAINRDDSTKSARVDETGYNLTGLEAKSNGFIIGHKEVEDAGANGYGGMFFRYWNPSAPTSGGASATRTTANNTNTASFDPQYSPSFPKLCYQNARSDYKNQNATRNYPTTIEKNSNGLPDHPLIRLASVGGDQSRKSNNSENIVKMGYRNTQLLRLPVVPMTSSEVQKAGTNITGITLQSNNMNTLDCNTNEGCTLDPNGNTCLNINPHGVKKVLANPDSIYGYNFADGSTTNRLVNCANGSAGYCGDNEVKSFKRDNSGEAYRISQFVRLDIDGNTVPIEIPQQTCYNCLNVNSGAVDTSCQYIVDEVYKAKGGNCAETVKALATNPRLVKSYLPATLQNGTNCTGCLCKIESLLRAKGCS